MAAPIRTAPQATMGEKFAFRARNPDSTKQDILDAARVEFANAGLSGARVDKIAESSGANKRMIYHYFGGKEELFAAVVLDAYVSIRAGEQKLGLAKMKPAPALRKLVEFTWHYYLKHPEFITLVNSENLHKARHLAGNEQLRELQQAYVDSVRAILDRGVAQGVFRAGIDAANLCITIAAVGFYYLNNRHTGAVLFGFDFISREALAQRLEFNIQTVMRMVLARPDEYAQLMG
jgi:AcrR family transcriptional regulator